MDEKLDCYKNELQKIKNDTNLDNKTKIIWMKNLLNKIKDILKLKNIHDSDQETNLKIYRDKLINLNRSIENEYLKFSIINKKLSEYNELKNLNLSEKIKAKNLFEKQINDIISKKK